MPTLFPGYVSLLSTRAEKLAHDTQAQELHRDMKQSTSALIKVTKEISAGLDLSVFGNDLMFDKNDDALRENTKYLSADLVLVSDKGGMFAFQRASRRQHFTSQTKPRAATGLTNESHHPCLPSPENPFGKFSTFLIGGASGAELLTEAITASEVGKTD